MPPNKKVNKAEYLTFLSTNIDSYIWSVPKASKEGIVTGHNLKQILDTYAVKQLSQAATDV